VTRPGLAAVASGVAVELLASILTHPDGYQFKSCKIKLRIHCKADQALDPMMRVPTSGLGIVPHQIRGFLSHFQNLIVTGQRYSQCTACSKTVQDTYLERGFSFLRDVFDDPESLERLTGLDKLHEDVADDGFSWSETDE
jgi:ubiquitin-like modifier-activating enzyme ATG7